ncbi:pyridine nucleotide-disulfide oxidoreductase/dicluster-binding protein [Desulfocurvus sp. DL9XJH121]
MDQKDLRRWEARCIQEEQPRCQAACPLHVDARALCAALASGKVDQAWAVLARTMPLPGVLARICDAPCQKACLREEAGGGLRLGPLERYCAQNAGRTPRVQKLPAKHKNAAVLGTGLAGLCAAWELARKGFSVTLFGPRAQGLVTELEGAALPTEVLDAELARLKDLGVVREDGDIPAPETALAAFDAVFADPEACPGAGPGDSLTLATAQNGLFAGNGRDLGSVAALASLGRRAANSMERFVQGASLTAGREREGAFESRLFTSTEGLAPEEPVAPAGDAYTEDEARAEAARCVQCQCLECVQNCVYLAHYKSYPKVYARRIYNNASIVMGTRQANQMINSCMLCGLCELLCPEDFAMADLCLEARRDLVAQGHMPPSAHEFALRDMAFANGQACALARSEPGRAECSHAFFPGCQLTASDPGAVERAYAHLRGALPGGVGLMLRCCGEPAHWAGREDLHAGAASALRADWEALGRPALVTACPTCSEALRRGLPEAEVRPLWDVLAETGAPANALAPDTPLAVHDPCAARHDAPQRRAVRDLLAGLGCTPVEPKLTGELTECCGFGGLLNAATPPLGAEAAAHRAQAADEDFVTYCAMCRDMLARAGKRALHVLDLLFPEGEDQAARPAPGHSARRENRARLKERLLAELWSEPGAPRPAHEALDVRFTDEAAQKMEDRRILVGDVQKTLLTAAETGRVLENADSGRLLASHRPASVTYWVEYEENGAGGHLVHNAWSHRMHIKGGRA